MLILDVLDEIEDPRRYNLVYELTDFVRGLCGDALWGTVHCTETALHLCEYRLHTRSEEWNINKQ